MDRQAWLQNKYRKLIWITVWLTLDLILFGAFTRLTDSGLGCPDWPGCYGYTNPWQAHAHISAAQAAMPTGPVTVTKAWIEMIHRYLAMGIGMLIITLTVLAWRQRFVGAKSRGNREENAGEKTGKNTAGLLPLCSSSAKHTEINPWYPTGLLAFVCLQGAFGAWTVTMKLQPVIVTIHLLLGMGLLALLGWGAVTQSFNASLGSVDSLSPVNPVSPANSFVPAAWSKKEAGLRGWIGIVALLVFVQIALGGWVSTNYAALACSDFPLCHGRWWPQMDFANGFTLWRELGKTGAGEYLPFPALTAIHWVHRNFAFVVLAAVIGLALRVRKIAALRALGNGLLMVAAWQLISGVSTIFLRWPLALAVAHNGGAAMLVLLLAMLHSKVTLWSRAFSSRPLHE